MNRLFIRPFLTIFCTAFLCIGTSFVFAEEEISNTEELSFEQQENSLEDLKEDLWSENRGYKDDSIYLQRIHNDAYYHLVAYSDNGDRVQLHDASKWEVQSSGRQKVLYWVQSNDIFIKPNASCFSSYRYVLQNRTKNETVEVNLINPPLPMGAATFRIVYIDPYSRLVHLSDNTVWQIDFKDADFRYWKIGHRVLIGVNNNWRTAPLPNVLINVDLHKEPYSKGNFYGYSTGQVGCIKR